ncbi:MAG: hypothetical protein WDA24_06265 [Tissierellales bacterium]
MQTLKEYKEVFSNNNIGNKNYEKNIDDFISYLESIGVKDIREVKFENFLSSIEDLFNKKIINRENTSHRYLEAIKTFYKYLKINEYAEDIFERATYKQDYEEFIDRIMFKDPIDNAELNKDMIKSILSFLDDYFFRFNDYNVLIDKSKKAEMNRYFKYLKLRLLIKITLLAPCRKSIISDIKFEHFSEKSRTIKINEVRVEVTNSLYRDLIEYKKFLFKYIIYDRDRDREETEYYKTYIFGDSDDFYGKLNEYLIQFVKDINGTNPKYKIPNINHETLRKTAISEMIDSKIDIRLISRLSGNDVSTLSQYYKKDVRKSISIEELMTLKYLKFI